MGILIDLREKGGMNIWRIFVLDFEIRVLYIQ